MKRVLLVVVVAHVAASAVSVQTLTSRRNAARGQTTDATANRVVAEKLPGFRLATSADFVPELRDQTRVPPATTTLLRADFNGDQLDDWAVLVINEKATEYRLYYVLNLPAGYRLDLLLSKTWQDPPVSQGVIRNAMFIKSAGQPGVAERHHARVLGDDRDPADPKNDTPDFKREWAERVQEYLSVPAIEVWTGPARIDAKDLRNFPDAGIAYCSTTWYYQKTGALAHFSACD